MSANESDKNLHSPRKCHTNHWLRVQWVTNTKKIQKNGTKVLTDFTSESLSFNNQVILVYFIPNCGISLHLTVLTCITNCSSPFGIKCCNLSLLCLRENQFKKGLELDFYQRMRKRSFYILLSNYKCGKMKFGYWQIFKRKLAAKTRGK